MPSSRWLDGLSKTCIRDYSRYGHGLRLMGLAVHRNPGLKAGIVQATGVVSFKVLLQFCGHF